MNAELGVDGSDFLGFPEVPDVLAPAITPPILPRQRLQKSLPAASPF